MLSDCLLRREKLSLNTQKVLDRITSVKDEKFIRGATLIRSLTARSARYHHISGMLRLPHVAEYSGITPFDCALRGPFDKVFLA